MGATGFETLSPWRRHSFSCSVFGCWVFFLHCLTPFWPLPVLFWPKLLVEVAVLFVIVRGHLCECVMNTRDGTSAHLHEHLSVWV